MKRFLGATSLAFVLVAAAAVPAFAHSEIQPGSAEAGATVPFNLFVEDEQSDASTVKVELSFPQPLVLAALPEAAGFTATAVGGSVGGEATGITWDGASESDVNVPFSLVMPGTEGRLQFKVLHTYDNGEVERWIAEWPAGAPEPDNPGPVVDVVASGTPTSAAQSPDEHAAEHAAEGDHDEATSEDEHAAEHAENGDHAEATPLTTSAESEDDSDDSNTGTIVLIAIIAVLVIGGGIAFVVMRKKGSSTGTPDGGTPPSDAPTSGTPTA